MAFKNPCIVVSCLYRFTFTTIHFCIHELAHKSLLLIQGLCLFNHHSPIICTFLHHLFSRSFYALNFSFLLEKGITQSQAQFVQMAKQHENIIELLQNVLHLAQELGHRRDEGSVYGNIGNAYHLLGDLQQAIQYHQKHLQIAKDLGDRAGEGGAYSNLGNAYQSLGDF